MSDPVSKITDLSDDLLAMLEHSLGIDRAPRPYRKYYVAPMWSSWFNDCEELVSRGLMVPFGEPDGVGQTYHVTAAGAAAVGAKLP